MPWFAAGDDLVRRPARILIAGTSGSGKSTLARRIAAALALPYFELDALHHGPQWTPRPQFAVEVQERSGEPAWVTEWQYPAVRALLADRADLLVWLDLPRPIVMRAVVRRTVARTVRRTELWNGNREPPLRTILTDHDHIVRWAWRTHGDHGPRVTECLLRHPELSVVRLRSRAEVDTWVTGPLARRATG